MGCVFMRRSLTFLLHLNRGCVVHFFLPLYSLSLSCIAFFLCLPLTSPHA